MNLQQRPLCCDSVMVIGALSSAATQPRQRLTISTGATHCVAFAVLAGKLSALSDAAAEGGVFLMAATLRPETMYGQTNCWALPEGQYGAYKGLNGEVYIMTYRSALNLSYQVRRYGPVNLVYEMLAIRCNIQRMWSATFV